MNCKASIGIAIIVFFIGCSENAPIEPKAMAKIMGDVLVLEAGNQVQYNYANIPQNIWKRDYAMVCKQNKTDTAQFRKAMVWYGNHPEQYSKILEQVIAKLQRLQVEPNKKTP